MTSFRAHFHWPLVLSALVALAANVHATDWFDDFNDGDAEDGSPVVWTPFPGLPGDYDASSGDYILTPGEDYDPNEGLVASVNGIVFSGDTYARTLAHVEFDSREISVADIGLAVRFDPTVASGYIGLFDNATDGTGVLTLVRIDFFTLIVLAVADVDITAATDAMIELSAVGDQLNLTVWEPGQPKPESQISTTDTSGNSPISSGVAGIIMMEKGNNDTAGVFRWVAAQDVSFVDCIFCNGFESGDTTSWSATVP